MAFAYFDTTHAIEVHDEIINQSGGVLGILNISLLESVTNWQRKRGLMLSMFVHIRATLFYLCLTIRPALHNISIRYVM